MSKIILEDDLKRDQRVEYLQRELYELEERFCALCEHLGVDVYKRVTVTARDE